MGVLKQAVAADTREKAPVSLGCRGGLSEFGRRPPDPGAGLLAFLGPVVESGADAESLRARLGRLLACLY